MLFKSTKDWKQYLSPEDEEKLNAIIRRVAKYRGSYKNSDEVKIAQLWSAILELYKQNLILQKRLDEVTEIFDSMTERLKKKCEDKKELIESLERF